jgi:hypothetical protein
MAYFVIAICAVAIIAIATMAIVVDYAQVELNIILRRRK